MQTAYVVPHSLTPKKPHEILQELLVKEPYRDMWGQFVQRRRGTGINVRAVATFMAYELSEDEDHELSPDQLKDSVRRALRGELMTDRAANRFIVAFGFTEDESALLWQSFIHHDTFHILLWSRIEKRVKLESIFRCLKRLFLTSTKRDS